MNKKKKLIDIYSEGISPWDFDPTAVSFTPGMAKRATSVFAAAPIVQGDVAALPSKGDGLITQNIATPIVGQEFYPYVDANQGSISFFLTPEFSTASDTPLREIVRLGSYLVLSTQNNTMNMVIGTGASSTLTGINLVAGTRYSIMVRWDRKNSIDGTNYICISINDTHTFGCTVGSTTSNNGSYVQIGRNDVIGRAYAGIIEGFTVYRRVLYDGTYGVNIGNGDEVALIAAGIDPTTVTGSWDVVFCLPTNASTGALVTGTGEAWSHPHSSNLLTRGFLNDTYYGGSQWALKFNGTTTKVDCGSGATLDDLPAGGIMQVEFWMYINGSVNNQIVISKGTGWRIWKETSMLRADIFLATTMCNPQVNITSIYGKWNHFVLHYDNTTRVGRWSVNGVWQPASTAGVGAYSSDAAANLLFGTTAGGGWFSLDGSLGWVCIHNNAHYTPGTDFVPSRAFPGADANTVEAWLLNEGTGTTVTATVTAPANNGTITAGTWEPQWYDEGTPVRLRSVVGSANYAVTITAAAEINDLADGAFTAEGWFRLDKAATYIMGKGNPGVSGWLLWSPLNDYLWGTVYCANTNAQTTVSSPTPRDRLWHYIKMTFDDAGDRKVRLYIDNVEATYSVQTAGVGAIISDAASNGFISGAAAPLTANSAHGWIRWSNVVRGAGMIPRSNPPDPADANTMGQWNADEGYGAVLTDLSGEGNNGAMAGTYSWNNSPAMESDSPGARNYAWGYVFGSDGPNEGLKQTWEGLTVGKDYVIRALAYSEDGVGQPTLLVTDVTNSGLIKIILGTVTSTEKSPDLLMASFELPTVARGAAADCTSISVILYNNIATGVVGFQQVELLANLLDNPSFDTGAVADPWIPDGYANFGGLGAGMSSMNILSPHSGNACLTINSDSGVKYITQLTAIPLTSGKYYDWGLWTKKDAGAGAYRAGDNGNLYLSRQANLAAVFTFDIAPPTSWAFKKAVGRATGNFNWGLRLLSITENGNFDDLYLIALDDVTLTVTPASAVNSVESGGIRVDGYDLSPQTIPAGRLFANSGWLRWRYIPRHNAANEAKFGFAETYIAYIFGDGNNYIRLYFSSATNLRLRHIIGGAPQQTGDWIHGGYFVAGGNYLMEIRYDANTMYLYVDNVLRTTIVAATGFTTIPTLFYSGTPNSATSHNDAVFLSP